MKQTQQVLSQQVAADDVLPADAAFGVLDVAVVLAVIALASWYLYRKFWRSRGQCSGCPTGSQCSSAKKSQAP